MYSMHRLPDCIFALSRTPSKARAAEKRSPASICDELKFHSEAGSASNPFRRLQRRKLHFFQFAILPRRRAVIQTHSYTTREQPG